MRVLVAASLAASLSLAQGAALAQSAPPSGGSAAPAAAGAPRANARQASAGRQAIARGGASYVARDYPAALAAFREAQTDRELRLEALLGVAYSLAARGELDEAIDALRSAVAQAISSNDDVNRARALQGLATLFEGAGRWQDAEGAWRDHLAFAESHSQVVPPNIARERLERIAQRAERERNDAAVRERIEARRRANGTQPQPQR